jgi:tetratricopeptide (TPR) repeat protein
MPTDHARAEVAELLELALADPALAEGRAREILEDTPDPWWSSVARHVLGLALRERGEGIAAIRELRTAVRLATRSGDVDRRADVRASLGLTLVTQGRTREGLSQLTRAADDARDPVLAAKVVMRRGLSLSWVLGRHEDGLADLRLALAGFVRADEQVWEARTRNLLGLLHLAVGEVAAAEDQLVLARELFLGLALEVEAAFALHNHALAASMKGDLPEAMTLFDRAAERYAELDIDATTLAMDRSAALLAAGLPDEAVRVVDVQLRRTTGPPVLRAELELRMATALLATDDADDAHTRARVALAAFRRTGRAWWAAQAELVALRAQESAGRVDRRHVTAAARVAAALTAERSDESAAAWLLAGRLAARLDPPAAPDLLARAAAYRSHRVALVRATAWLAHGLAKDLAGDRRGVHLACRRGLDALDAHRATLGSSELRALATGHGTDLARLALAHSVDAPPRTLLWWSERWRATALTEPPVRPDGDDETSAPLAALRDNARRLLANRSEGADVARLELERARLEDDVRRRLRHAAGTASTGALVDVAALVEAVGDGTFVEIVEVGQHLHAVTVRGGRVRTVTIGSTADAMRAVEVARYALRRAARGRPERVAEAGRRLQVALLGVAADRLGDAASVVVSPPSRLHAAPWGLLPVLTGVPHSVVPSAALWMRAGARQQASERRVFVCGPGLTTGGGEIKVVAPRHPGAVVLRDGSATVDRCLQALDGAALAHIAAHGHFRDDSPLFSALDLDDGPLTVHDFERMEVPPHRVVLSACESGVMAPVGSGELLGLVSALLSVGTAGVVASVEVVNDDATAELMVDLHAGLEDGDDLATALLRARLAAADDPVRAATAASFLALGV